MDGCKWNVGRRLVNCEVDGGGIFVCCILLWVVFVVCEWEVYRLVVEVEIYIWEWVYSGCGWSGILLE